MTLGAGPFDLVNDSSISVCAGNFLEERNAVCGDSNL